MLTSLTSLCHRRRCLVLVGWVALLAAAIALSGAVGGELRNDFAMPGSPSKRAADLLESGGFGGEAGHRGQVVVASDERLDEADRWQPVAAYLARVERQVGGVVIRDPLLAEGGLLSSDGTIAIVDLELGDVDQTTASERASDIASIRSDTDFGPDLTVELGGEVFYEESEFSSEGIGMLAAVVIMLVAFGSVIAAGLPIVTALFGIGTGMAIVMVFARFVDVPDFAPAAVAMVTIGVGIDYALFIVTRYREELAAGRTPERAVSTAMVTAGRAVMLAGTTVVIAMAGLFAVGVSATRALAVGISAGVLMVMLASVTLLPALLGFAGTDIDRWSLRRKGLSADNPGSLVHRWSLAVQRRPRPIAAVGLLVILVLTLPAASMRLGFGDAGNRPETDTARRAYDLVTEAFGPGFNGPLFIAAELSGDQQTDGTMLDTVSGTLAALPGIANASPPAVSDDRTVAVIQVFPTTSPQDEATAALVVELRDETLPAIEAPGTELLVGGAVAAVVDFADREASRLPLFIGSVLAVSFVALTVVFRSVVVALKAVVLNLLSISAAYGVIVAVFQWGWGAGVLGIGEGGPIEAWAPMMLFAILFGLSMDYEVFLLSRIREEYDHSGDAVASVAHGLARTARLITAAAAIMIFVFGGFVLSDERALQIFGLGLAVAILVDVTIVRLLLVPSTMAMLGERNWWLPAWLARWLPHRSHGGWRDDETDGTGTDGPEGQGGADEERGDVLQRTPSLSRP